MREASIEGWDYRLGCVILSLCKADGFLSNYVMWSFVWNSHCNEVLFYFLWMGNSSENARNLELKTTWVIVEVTREVFLPQNFYPLHADPNRILHKLTNHDQYYNSAVAVKCLYIFSPLVCGRSQMVPSKSRQFLPSSLASHLPPPLSAKNDIIRFLFH